ncbi:MAG TPA: cytochrome c maturation protein CcmE, partial [Alphaproteobacteria bacterium]|nr:cytochrome c maturation protein CcmE [Alphaproteobacteria bacterium]
MTPRGKQRLTIIIIVLLSLTGAAALASYALREDVMYFQSPTDVIARQTQAGQNFRLGGIVAKGSI